MVNIPNKPLDTLQKMFQIIIILIGIYLIIQVLRKILGGSWDTEDIIIALLIFNLGCTFTIAITFVQVKSDHKHLKDQFKSLADDFKKHISKK